MATTTTKHLLQHPCHDHPLELLLDLTNETETLLCRLCFNKIWTEAYTCQEGCKDYYYHRVCAEAPLQIDRHPLHPVHPLTLIHEKPAFGCDGCGASYKTSRSSFWCCECDFDLDLCCALSSLSDVGGSQGGKTSEQITLPLHPHKLTSFSTRHDFVGDSFCYICRGSVEGDGYTCLRWHCEFVIHKRCIQDLYYADGTKAPRVFHGHPLEIYVGEDTGTSTCAGCGSNKLGEFIGCASCQVFYHRNCFQVPEILNYPHHQKHTLILFITNHRKPCRSCSCPIQRKLCYLCIPCNFHLHIGCAIRTIGYYEDGMSPEIELSWHDHPMLLCHRGKPFSDLCSCCEDDIDGPAYVCGEKDCGLVLHKQCTELMPKINHHPHHPDHPLALLAEVSKGVNQCAACHLTIKGFSFSCKLCEFCLHVNCMSRFPTRKHYFHEHDLVQFDKISSSKCNRCRTADNSPLFRCVPCNFNLHEKCMELPLVVKHKTHFHPLTLREFFREDDSGEYYCDLCEKRRDGWLGVYVCGNCELKMDQPWAFHVECVLPELRKVYVKDDNTIAMERLADEITRREDEVCDTERKLDEMTRELEKLRKKHAAMALK